MYKFADITEQRVRTIFENKYLPIPAIIHTKKMYDYSFLYAFVFSRDFSSMLPLRSRPIAW